MSNERSEQLDRNFFEQTISVFECPRNKTVKHSGNYRTIHHYQGMRFVVYFFFLELFRIKFSFSTFQISKDDRLPDKLCLDCFQSIRFINKFREKSLRSENLLTAKLNALRKSTRAQNLVKVIRLKRIPKPVPKRHNGKQF